MATNHVPVNGRVDDTKVVQQIIATITLSGEAVNVGLDCDDDPSVFLIVPDHAEPIYMAPTEAAMLIAALSSALAQATGKES